MEPLQTMQLLKHAMLSSPQGIYLPPQGENTLLILASGGSIPQLGLLYSNFCLHPPPPLCL